MKLKKSHGIEYHIFIEKDFLFQYIRYQEMKENELYVVKNINLITHSLLKKILK